MTDNTITFHAIYNFIMVKKRREVERQGGGQEWRRELERKEGDGDYFVDYYLPLI